MSEPARLYKKTDNVSLVNHIFDKIEAWALSHAFIILFVLFALLMALFIILITALVGVSATDSGMTYNAMERII